MKPTSLFGWWTRASASHRTIGQLNPKVLWLHALFSDSQTQLVARILNNSLKPESLRTNSLLNMAEPVQCLSSTGVELDNLLCADSDSANVSVLPDESVKPVSSSLQPAMAAD